MTMIGIGIESDEIGVIGSERMIGVLEATAMPMVGGLGDEAVPRIVTGEFHDALRG